jgi:hypothetical protein
MKQRCSPAASVGLTPAATSGAASAERQLVQGVPSAATLVTLHRCRAEVKSTTLRTAQAGGGGAGGDGGSGRGGGAGGGAQSDVAERVPLGTPAVTAPAACDCTQTASTAAVVTPAAMKGCISAGRQVEHAEATVVHAPAAALKSCAAVTGQVVGGGGAGAGGGGAGTGGGGEEGCPQAPRARRDERLTPAPIMALL